MTNIPADYRLTEVGVIPEEWDVDVIGNLASVTTGDKNTEDKVDDGIYPFFVRSSEVERINSYSFDGEAILTAGDGVGTGKIFHYINGKFDFHQRVYKISDFSDRLDGRYFYFYFSVNFYSRIMSMTAKSSVDSVRRDMIVKMPLSLPPLDEQRAIADALSEVDDRIAALDAAIAKKRDLKQGAMQRLLTGEKRLPGCTGVWDKVTIEKLCKTFTKQTGFDYSASIKPSLITTYESNYIPFIQNKDFRGKNINFRTDYFVPYNLAKSFPEIILDERCLLISISGSIGNVGLFTNEMTAFVGGAIAVGKFKNPKYLDWVMYYLHSDEGQRMLFGDVKAGSHHNLTLEDIRKFEIPIPTQDEQNLIISLLSDMDAEISTLEEQREKTRTLKQGMMQDLLTGKVRLV